MAAINDTLYVKGIGPSQVYNAAGNLEPLANGAQTLVGTVAAVNGSNEPTIINPANSSSLGTPSSPSISGLEYNSTAPTLTNGQTDALQGDSNANLKVNPGVLAGSRTQAATLTITAGGTSQQLFPAVPAGLTRVAYFIQNQSIGMLSTNIGANASATIGAQIAMSGGSLSVSASKDVMEQGAINIWGATTSQAFYAYQILV